MNSFRDYKNRASQYITFVDSAFYPDYLDQVPALYGSVLEQFEELAQTANSSTNLLINITEYFFLMMAPD